MERNDQIDEYTDKQAETGRLHQIYTCSIYIVYVQS